MSAYSLRLEKIRAIFEDIPNYLMSMKRKVITLYSRNIFFPLMKMKREIIEAYN